MYVGFEVLTILSVVRTVLCGVTPFSSERPRNFEGTNRLHLQGLTASQPINQQTQGTNLPHSDGFLLGLLFDSGDEGDMFHEMSICLRTTRRHNPEDRTFHTNVLC
jgi:hypothetical protein